jgi:hypothetical protein
MSVTISTNHRLVGTINERGYINGFERRGFTPSKCLSELVANVMDSMDKVQLDHSSYRKKCLFEVNRDTIKMIDNGFGMNETSLERMYDMHSENHRSEASRGVSGIGSKPSQFILSQKTEVRIYTRIANGEYLCAVAPWDIINEEGVYTGKIRIQKQTAEEKLIFVQDRSRNGMLCCGEAIGTTTEFRRNDLLFEVIESAFKHPDTQTNPHERIGIIFGRDDVELLYKHHDEVSPLPLNMYNYFGAHHGEYYNGGFAESQIYQMYSQRLNKHRFIWIDEEDQYEIKSVGRGFATKISIVDENFNGYARIGTYTVRVGLRKDTHIYDLENPSFVLKDDGTVLPMTADNSRYYSSYLKEHLGENETYMTRAKLVRNNQEIGLIPPEVNIGSARADGGQYLKIKLVQCEVSFNPVSSHNNLQDRVMNVQENKNQFDGDSLPKNFTRLVAAIKDEKANHIWAQLSTAAQAAHRALQPVPVPVVPNPVIPVPVVPVPGPQYDADSEPSSDSNTEDEPVVPVPVPIVPNVPGLFFPRPLTPPPFEPIQTGSLGRDILRELRKAIATIDEGAMYPEDSLAAHLYGYLLEFNDVV